MQWWMILAVYVFVLIIFAIIHKIAKIKRPVKQAFLSMIFGVLCLVAVNAVSVFTHVTIPFSILNLSVCAFGGLPGATLLLALNVLL